MANALINKELIIKAWTHLRKTEMTIPNETLDFMRDVALEKCAEMEACGWGLRDAMLCAGLNDAAQQIHAAARNKGFWDSERETGTLLMLCVSELSEALEADRENRFAKLEHYEENMKGYTPENSPLSFESLFTMDIKDTFEDEIADTVIRILDLCGARGIDIERHINLKLKYNATRERMHGKSY